jgi:hypothetical protein
VDSAGSIVVGGLGSNVISFGSEPTGPSGGWDGIVAKLGPEFEPIWTLRFGSLFDDATNALALDADANVFAVGHFRSSVTFGSCAPLQSAGDADMLLMKLAP